MLSFDRGIRHSFSCHRLSRILKISSYKKLSRKRSWTDLEEVQTQTAKTEAFFPHE